MSDTLVECGKVNEQHIWIEKTAGICGSKYCVCKCGASRATFVDVQGNIAHYYERTDSSAFCYGKRTFTRRVVDTDTGKVLESS